MDEELREILNRLISSEDDTGCSYDPDDPDSIHLTVVNKGYVDELKQYLKHYDLGGM